MWNPGVLVLLAVFATALLGCIALVMTQRWHGRLSLDHDLTGVQKIHLRPVPRVGGVAVFSALLVGGLGALWVNEPLAPHILMLLLCSLPAFLAGLIEDLTKRVGVRTRLYASFASAALAIWSLNAELTRLDTPGLNYLITFAPVAVLFTCFAVGGLTNAVNIIDGINGLAAGSVILMMSGLGVLAWLHHDIFVFELCMLGIAALAGFIVLNFPGGKIFLGDGGAYLAGFWLAECAVLLLARNPEVSTWAVLLMCLYPVWETIFSMMRRRISRADSRQPDQVHLHHVLMNRLKSTPKNGLPASHKEHALTSLLIWTLVITCQALVLTHRPSDSEMVAGALWFAMTYGCLYWFAHPGKTLNEQALPMTGTLSR
ncbi:glycosyltransferase [Aquabacterium sp.]|uniref:MraY family glycosyltransferase n=1 Tax=Aquabacterium sp. TaxID=1872578 RepID=UPI0019C7DB54|nr:glycosyltransferase [Aquabacterium sp.]MBC7700870.1 glycosyltransferase family 4 protein [Aquabacterium sp.]